MLTFKKYYTLLVLQISFIEDTVTHFITSFQKQIYFLFNLSGNFIYIYMQLKFKLTPFLNRNLKASRCPNMQTLCRAEKPLSSVSLKPYPWSSKYFNMYLKQSKSHNTKQVSVRPCFNNLTREWRKINVYVSLLLF